jgi:hypothetical protein
VTAMRSAVHLGLACFAPLLCWLLFELLAIPFPVLAPAVLSAMLCVQALAIALWVPLLPAAPADEHSLAAMLLALVPAPLGALLWLSGAVSIAALARAQLALIALALAVVGCTLLLARSARFAPLLRGSLAALLMALLWQLRPQWLELLTP